MGSVQQELALVDGDIALRYFGGPVQPAARRFSMNFAIRFLTEYRYTAPVTDNLNALRVKPATRPPRASRTSSCAWIPSRG